MPEINFQQAKEFLNQISEKDNIAIIHHDDADGFCSGILFQDHCQNKGAKISAFTYSHSKTKISKLPLYPFNKIIITDISSKGNFEEIAQLKNKQILYSDHHPKAPLPEETLTVLTSDKGYIPSSRTAYELVGGKKWLALIGVLADAGDLYKENTPFIEKTLRKLNLTLEEFKTRYSHIFSNTIVHFAKTPEKTFQTLSKISTLEQIKSLEKYSNEVEEEIQKFVKEYKTKKETIGNINIYQFEPKFEIKGIVTSILGRTYPEEIIMIISNKTSNKNLMGISARHQAKNANLPKLLEETTKDLENSNSGGHLKASGGQIMAKDLEKFKQNLRNYAAKD